MKQLVIIGGGFAGLWAAFSAFRKAHLLQKTEEVNITLINKDEYHGLRPRFYEAELEDTRRKLIDYLQPLNIRLIIDEVNNINTENQTIHTLSDTQLAYDRLIIAAGSHLITQSIPGLETHAFNVDTFDAAMRLKHHIDSLPHQPEHQGQYTLVVSGGGFTGVEAATDFMDRLRKTTPANKKPRVIVIDRSEVASRFSDETKNTILQALHAMGIETRPHTEITEVNKNTIQLSNGETLATSTLVWTAGMQSSDITQKVNTTRDHFGRLSVDRYLRVEGINNCFAAGDVAAATTDGEHMALLSCQHAMPQGRFAGNNAIASLFDDDLLLYEQPKFVTSIDLGSWGALYAEGWDQRIASSKEEAKKIKQFINLDRIYPPQISDKTIDALLDAANPIFKPIDIKAVG